MLRGASTSLLSFAGDRPGALAWVARGIGEHLRREALDGSLRSDVREQVERAQRRRAES